MWRGNTAGVANESSPSPNIFAIAWTKSATSAAAYILLYIQMIQE